MTQTTKTYGVQNGFHAPVGTFTRKADAEELARQMRAANRQAGNTGTVKVVTRTADDRIGTLAEGHPNYGTSR